jgi:hypothetical protein
MATSSENNDLEKRGQPSAGLHNWVFLRKFETFVFVFMFLALPFFALKVLLTTTATLEVKHAAKDLVKSLLECQEWSREKHQEIKIVSKASTKPGERFRYVVIQESKVASEIDLPPGVTIYGTVTFTNTGAPKGPASFLIAKGNKTTHVEIDPQGMISSP